MLVKTEAAISGEDSYSTNYIQLLYGVVEARVIQLKGQ